MLAFVASFSLGLLVGFLWLLLWGIALRTPLLVWFMRTPEERAKRQQRFMRMGRVRYVLLVGILGRGLAFGLGMTIAGIADDGVASWGRTIAKLIILSLFWGGYYGSTSWDMHFRSEVPFPPGQ